MKSQQHKILLLNGPNLNLLGTRENKIYGNITLADINHELQIIADKHDVMLTNYQSNHEGELINKTQDSITQGYSFLIINPAGYTHTSVAWRDAVLAVNIPFIEVHISNVYARDEFRKKSYFSDIAIGVISGLGKEGYIMALQYAIKYLIQKE